MEIARKSFEARSNARQSLKHRSISPQKSPELASTIVSKSLENRMKIVWKHSKTRNVSKIDKRRSENRLSIAWTSLQNRSKIAWNSIKHRSRPPAPKIARKTFQNPSKIYQNTAQDRPPNSLEIRMKIASKLFENRLTLAQSSLDLAPKIDRNRFDNRSKIVPNSFKHR